jgi:uncharacterized protein GlcG (DUF336 family)
MVKEGSADLLPTVTSKGAKRMIEEAENIADQTDLSCFVVVVSRTGMQERSAAIGDGATPMNVEIALDKIKTVLAVRRSTTLQREWMSQKRQNRDDFAGQIGSLFSGGVAILLNGEFAGAMACSSVGSTPQMDDKVCLRSILAAGFETDLPT